MSVNLQIPDFCRSRDAFRMQLTLPKLGGLTTECGSMRRNLHHLAGESFSGKTITVNRKVIGMVLRQRESYRLIKAVNELFDKRVKHQRIKKFGKYSRIRTAIREESIKLAQYLREEKRSYKPTEALL